MTKLIVGFDNAYPPYGFIGDDGKETGFDLDLAAEVAERNGWDLELQAIDWDAKDALLNQGSINCIWNGFTMEGREDDYTFSEPYMLQRAGHRREEGFGHPIRSRGLRARTSSRRSTPLRLTCLRIPRAVLIWPLRSRREPPDHQRLQQCVHAARGGMVDAVACDLSIAAYQMAAKPDAYVQLSGAVELRALRDRLQEGVTPPPPRR